MQISAFPHLNLAALPGPDTIARRVFPNGAVGLAYENTVSPSVIVYGWLRVGNVDVPPDKAGLSSFTAAMLTRGTANRSFTELGEQVESLGAVLSTGGFGHTTRFTIKCLAEDLPVLLDMLTDCLFQPAFPSEYVEKRRGEILTAIEQRQTNTQAMSSMAFSELMFPNHPYSSSSLGYQHTVSGLTRADMDAFYRRCYGAQGMGVAIVGGIERQRGLDMLEAALGTWQGASYVQSPLPPVSPISTIQEKRVIIPGKSQSDLILGWLGIKRTDDDFIPVYVADCILGEFGMMGRLGDQVRDEQGLAYYVSTSLDAGLSVGPWSAAAGVDPGNVERAVQGILQEVRRLIVEPVEPDELDDNKSYIIGSIPLQLESNEGIAAQLAEIEVYQLGLDYMQRFPAMIAAVTDQDVMRVAHTYLNPQAFVLAVAGPASE